MDNNNNVQNVDNNVNEGKTEGLEIKEDKNTTQKKTSRKAAIVAGIVCVAFVIVACVFFVYSRLMSNPTDIVKGSINDFYTKLSGNLDDLKQSSINYNIAEDSITLNGNLKLGGTLFKDLENTKIGFAGGLDYKNKKAEVSAILNENATDIADVTVYFKDNNSYVKSKTAFDNVYNIGEVKFDEYINLDDYINTSDTITIDEIDTIVKDFKDVLIKSLDEKQMTKGKEKIDVNGTSVNANTLSYKLNKETVKDLFSKVAKELANDDNFVDLFGKMTGMNKDEVLDELSEMEKDTTYDNIEGEGLFTVYTTGTLNDYVGFKISDLENDFIYYDYKDKTYIAYNESNKAVFEITSKEEKNVKNIKVNYFDEGKKMEIANLDVREFSNNKIDFDYTITLDDIEIKGFLKCNSTKNSDKEITNKIEFNLESNLTESENFSVTGNLDYTIAVGGSVADVDTSQAKNIEEMTDADTIKFQNLINTLQKTKFYGYISQYLE